MSDVRTTLRGDFLLWWLGSLGMNLTVQMLQTAIGWQVFAISHSALSLGLVGLAEFAPLALLALPAGHIADVQPRRVVFAMAIVVIAAISGGLAVLSAAGAHSVWPLIALAAVLGAGMAFAIPAADSMPPTLVGTGLLPTAMTLASASYVGGAIAGPAIGGILFGFSPVVMYSVGATFGLIGAACVVAIRQRQPVPDADADAADTAQPQRVRDLAEGVRFVARTPVLLGAMLLDLLAVLFGGTLALLPLFAHSVLGVGPSGLGFLRAAPAVGSITAGFVLAHRPATQRMGRTLFFVVAVFGASMAGFGLSRSFGLSLAFLAVGGFVDMFSMTIRATIVALATPESLRGRVLAVEMAFISASNELGAFESGLAASIVGAVPAVVGGGVIAIVLALGWGRLFPALRAIDEPSDISPEPGVMVVTNRG